MATNREALHLATLSGWYRYDRTGEDWRQTDRALTFWQMSCIQVDPENPRRVYIGTERSGMFVSDNGGKEWIRANPNVPCLAMSSMLALPGRLLVGTTPAEVMPECKISSSSPNTTIAAIFRVKGRRCQFFLSANRAEISSTALLRDARKHGIGDRDQFASLEWARIISPKPDPFTAKNETQS